jgi:hypothetical protein
MVELRGDGIDDGSITAYRWTLIESPAGSAARPPSPSDARVTQFLPDVAGDYRIRLEVTDNDGNVGECDFLVSAIPREGLRIEIFWNGPVDRSCDTMPGAGCDDTDVDLHLLRPGTEAWFNSRADCHYANCIDGRLNWGDSSTVDDNPSLDIDDVEGFGPENINIEEPALGVYRVGVHLFDGGSRRDADVTVNIFCGAGSTTPVATFGPVELDEGVGPNDFWKVADVEIQSVGCAVRDLAVGGVPAIVTDRDARASR